MVYHLTYFLCVCREAATTEVDTGIEGILNRLEKQRNLTLGFVLRDKEVSTGDASNDNKHDWSHETSTDAVSLLYLSCFSSSYSVLL